MHSMEDIRMHLLSKELLWSNEDKDKRGEVPFGQNAFSPNPIQSSPSPIIIEGVFDATVAVERVLRLAAKFVTAEEEAESRKEEIEALKKRRETPSSESTTTTLESAAYEETCSIKENSTDCAETMDETTVEVTSLGTADPDWVSADAETPTPKQMSRCLSSEALESPGSPHPGCPTPFGAGGTVHTHSDNMSMSRHVLSSVDPELIARLNKLLLPKDRVTSAMSSSLCPSTRSTPCVSREEAEQSPDDREEGREELNNTDTTCKRETETDGEGETDASSNKPVIPEGDASSSSSPYRKDLSPWRTSLSPRRVSLTPHCATLSLSPHRASISPCRTAISPYRAVLPPAIAPALAIAPASVPVPDFVRPPMPFKGSQSKLLQVSYHHLPPHTHTHSHTHPHKRMHEHSQKHHNLSGLCLYNV